MLSHHLWRVGNYEVHFLFSALLLPHSISRQIKIHLPSKMHFKQSTFSRAIPTHAHTPTHKHLLCIPSTGIYFNCCPSTLRSNKSVVAKLGVAQIILSTTTACLLRINYSTFIITVTHILRGSKRQLAPLYRTFPPRIQFADGRDRNCCCTFTKILT